MCTADLRNPYLQALSSQEKCVIDRSYVGLEYVHRAINDGVSTGRVSKNHLRFFMGHLDCGACPEDPDVWIKPAIRSDITPYYDCILLYVNDALVVVRMLKISSE